MTMPLPSLLPARCDWRAPPVVLLAALAMAAEGAPLIAWTPAQAEAAGVRTLTLAAAPVQPGAGLVLQGQVELPPQATELLSAPLAGVVQQVLVAPGERVKAGQAVARLLSPELLAWQRELAQAQSQARLAASRLAQDEQAQLAVQERRQALQSLGLAGGGLQPQVLLRATAPATVLEVSAVPGQRLDAGMPVARLARSGRLAIVLQATPGQARSLRVGDALALEGCRAPARLAAIVPQVLGANQAVQVRADFTAAEDCLRLQQFVQEFLSEGAAGKGGYLADRGLIPLPEDQLAAQRAVASALTPMQRPAK